MVTLYIVGVTVLMLASAVWRYRQRDMLGMAASLLVAGLGVFSLLLSSSPRPGGACQELHPLGRLRRGCHRLYRHG